MNTNSLQFIDFDDIPLVEPSPLLEKKIMGSIIIMQNNLKRKIIAAYLILAMFMFVFGYFATLLYSSMQINGTFAIFRSIIENIQIVQSAWQDSLLAITENIPIAELIYFLTSAMLVLYIVKYIAKLNIYSHKNLINQKYV